MKVLFFIGYLLLGLLQIAAFAVGLQVWLGIPTGFGFLIAFFVGPIPLLGTILGMVGAHSAWGLVLVGSVPSLLRSSRGCLWLRNTANGF